jgi:hypothetical protein
MPVAHRPPQMAQRCLITHFGNTSPPHVPLAPPRACGGACSPVLLPQRHRTYRKNTNSYADLTTPMDWQKALHH